MPKTKTLLAFIKAVEHESHDKVTGRFYTDDATIQENQNEPKVGLKNLIENERRTLGRAKKVTSKCVLPFFIAENNVIIKWRFRFEWKDDTTSEMEEIAYQVWEGEKIKKEQFFYDPKQFIPKKNE